MESDSDDESVSFVVDPDIGQFADYNVSHLPADPSAYLIECGEALRAALDACPTMADVMDADVTKLASAIDRLWAVNPAPVAVESETASRFLRGAVSKRFVNAALHHRPGSILNVLMINPTLSIVDQLRRHAIDRNLQVNMNYFGDVDLKIGNRRLQEKVAKRERYHMIIVCHGSKFLHDEQYLEWGNQLTTDGVISVLAVNRAAAGNCFDVHIKDVGDCYNFGFYGKDYLEYKYSLERVVETAKKRGLRVTCYDHTGLSMIANNLPFGGEFSGKIDAWKAYEVLFVSAAPLPVIKHAYTPIGEPLDMFLSRPLPMSEEVLVSLQQSRFLVKEKTDGIPLIFKEVDGKVCAFSYRDRAWHCESYPLPDHPLKHPLQVEARSDNQVITFYYIDYFAPGDFLERRLAFRRENHSAWKEKIVDNYREPDQHFFKDFLDHTKHEGFVVQPTNTPFIVGKPSCFYLKGVPSVDLSFEDAVRYSRDARLDWSKILSVHWEGIHELSLDGEYIRKRGDKTRSNTYSEFCRVKNQVPYLYGLFSLVEVSADLGILDLEPQVVEEIKARYRSKRSYDREYKDPSPRESE